jgi:hypothetical protein
MASRSKPTPAAAAAFLGRGKRSDGLRDAELLGTRRPQRTCQDGTFSPEPLKRPTHLRAEPAAVKAMA